MQGTVFWMAPEVVNSKGKGYNSKIDIWSVGCVVFEMWTGQRPWSGQEAMAVLLRVSRLCSTITGPVVHSEFPTQLFQTKQAPPVPHDVRLSTLADDFRLKCFAAYVMILLLNLLVLTSSLVIPMSVHRPRSCGDIRTLSFCRAGLSTDSSSSVVSHNPSICPSYAGHVLISWMFSHCSISILFDFVPSSVIALPYSSSPSSSCFIVPTPHVCFPHSGSACHIYPLATYTPCSTLII